MLDSLSAVETPEGVELELRLAGPYVRTVAGLIDLLVRAFLDVGAVVVAVAAGDVGSGLLLVFVFANEWFYPVFFEVVAGGATPGKRLLGLTVVHDDGTPVRLPASILRNLLRAVDFFPVAFFAGLVATWVHPRFKRLGDIVAGTVVVYRTGPRRAVTLPPGHATPIPVRLSLEEQRALIAFAERRPTWSDERAEELAGILEPLHGRHGPPAVQALLGMARWAWGAR